VTHFDVFNGDADGLCALHQLRLETPIDSVLVSGAKRDIALLDRLGDARDGDSVTALDISLDANRSALLSLLDRGVRVEWFDHHYAGAIPRHRNLATTIETVPDTCTGMLVDRRVGGRFRAWAVVAAFGDNLFGVAERAAVPLALLPAALGGLRALGEALAYNAYADVETDLIVHPAVLYRTLARHADPFEFMREEPLYERIARSRSDDLERARAEEPAYWRRAATVYVLPDALWSRRIRGAFANELAMRFPDRAHAIATPNAHGGYTVSVRAPLVNATGADELCRRFPSGGGRAAAAGINQLPGERLPELVAALESAFGSPP
jgi:hypothetical protein